MTNLVKEPIVLLNLQAKEEDQAFDEMITSLHAAGAIKSVKAFKRAIIKREKLSSTGFGEGVAIPHAKHRTVKHPMIVFARSKDGVNYNSHDGKPVHLLFMLAMPLKTNDVHLEVLSQLARRLMHASFKEQLLIAETEEAVKELLKETY